MFAVNDNKHASAMGRITVIATVTDMDGDRVDEIICACASLSWSDCDASNGTVNRLYIGATVGVTIGGIVDCVASILGVYVGTGIELGNELSALGVLTDTNVFIMKFMSFINTAIPFVDLSSK